MHVIYSNNESVSPNPRNPLEDYTIYVVDVHSQTLVHKLTFNTDKIFLSHNQVWQLTQFFSVSFRWKIIDLPGGQINDP